jgi:hypothetical protein
MVAKHKPNNTVRLLSWLSVLCFVATFRPVACEAACAEMPCCEHDEVTAQTVAQGIPCCSPEAPFAVKGLETPKLGLTPPPVRLMGVVVRMVFAVRWEPIHLTEGAVSILPVYLKNQVFRC